MDAALATARLVRTALAEVRDSRPFFDSEHGPIHTFKDHHITLHEPFDNEYFRHIQWAHLAAGGAGGGMRWPNRHPHRLTHGMRMAQQGMARFLPLLDWTTFRRRNWNDEIRASHPALAVTGCGDETQALIWLLRRDIIGVDGRLQRNADPLTTHLRLPTMRSGLYRMTAWHTGTGVSLAQVDIPYSGAAGLSLETPPIYTDLALALRRIA